LDRRGIPHRRGGRSPARLAALPASDAGEPFVVDAGEPARLTVPRHLPDARVWSAVVVPAPIAPIVERVAAPAAVAGARLLGRVAGRLPEGPPNRLRARARFRVL